MDRISCLKKKSGLNDHGLERKIHRRRPAGVGTNPADSELSRRTGDGSIVLGLLNSSGSLGKERENESKHGNGGKMIKDLSTNFQFKKNHKINQIERKKKTHQSMEEGFSLLEQCFNDPIQHTSASSQHCDEKQPQNLDFAGNDNKHANENENENEGMESQGMESQQQLLHKRRDSLNDENDESPPALTRSKSAVIWSKRQRVLKELLSTETSYVAQLQCLVDIYYLPLSALLTHQQNNNVKSSKCILSSHNQLAQLFGNVQTLYQLNIKLLSDLTQAPEQPVVNNQNNPNSPNNPILDVSGVRLPPGWASQYDVNKKAYYYYNTTTHHTQWDPPVFNKLQKQSDSVDVDVPAPVESRLVGPVFLAFGPFLKLYSAYASGLETALKLLQDLTSVGSESVSSSSVEQFLNFTIAAAVNPLCKGLNLQSLLITPVYININNPNISNHPRK